MQIVSVAGTAVPAAPIASVSPPSLTFATQAVGTTSGTQPVTLTNAGSAPLNLTSLAITGSNASSFGYYAGGTNACPLPSGTVAVGATCSILVEFIPQGNGAATATFNFSDNANGSPQTVALSGTGIAATEVSVTPDSVAFGTQTVGLTTAPVGITLTNTGNSVMTISKIAVSPASAVQFAETNNCAAALGPKASCLINATFNAPQAGTWTATILLTDDALESPQAISLSGTSVSVSASLAPPGPIAFGAQLAGTTSAPKVITVNNTGTSPAVLKVSAASVGDPTDYAVTNGCTAMVPAAGSCTLSVTFNPAPAPATATCGSTSGAKNTTLSINDNVPGSPQTIALAGSATDFCVDPPGLTAQTVTAGTSAAYQVDLVPFTGFTGSVALACTDPALASVCTVQPTTASLSNSAPVPIQVTVTTTAAAALAGPRGGPRSGPIAPTSVKLLLALLMLMALWTTASARRLQRGTQLAQSLAMTALLAISLAACFGGASGTSTATGTLSGTYTLTITATSGSTTRTIPLTLVVHRARGEKSENLYGQITRLRSHRYQRRGRPRRCELGLANRDRFCAHHGQIVRARIHYQQNVSARCQSRRRRVLSHLNGPADYPGFHGDRHDVPGRGIRDVQGLGSRLQTWRTLATFPAAKNRPLRCFRYLRSEVRARSLTKYRVRPRRVSASGRRAFRRAPDSPAEPLSSNPARRFDWTSRKLRTLWNYPEESRSVRDQARWESPRVAQA